MRSWLPCSAAVLVLAGCGGSDKPVAAPQPTATPPPADELKADLLTAVIQLDAYRLAEDTFTADERQLGAAFPPTVTIKEAGADSFYLAAYDDRHIRYALRRDGDTTERTCAPEDDEDCPGGEW
jgi:hypothetical protein